MDRKTLFLTAALMPDKTARAMQSAAKEAFAAIPPKRRLTLTVDNGKEFAGFKEIQHRTELEVYFADPYRACQRAISENTNGLLRQYLPKKTDFQSLAHAQLQSYVDRLNNRPRKKLNYRTPSEVFLGVRVALRL